MNEEDKSRISVQDYLILRKELRIRNGCVIVFGCVAFLLSGLLLIQDSSYHIFLSQAVILMVAMGGISVFPIRGKVNQAEQLHPEWKNLKPSRISTPSNQKVERYLIMVVALVLLLIFFVVRFDFERGLQSQNSVMPGSYYENYGNDSIVPDDSVMDQIEEELKQ